MKILSTSFLSHDSSISVIENGEITEYILAERKSRAKHDNRLENILQNYHLKNKNINYISNSIFNKNYIKDCENIFEGIKEIPIQYDTEDHHLCHAYCGFYTSKFEESLCIVMDGNGSSIDIGRKDCNNYLETLSIYHFKNGKMVEVLLKEYVQMEFSKNNCPQNISTNDKFFNLKTYQETYNKKNLKQLVLGFDTDYILGIGLMYQLVTEELGFDTLDCGKVMGLAQYKNYEHKLPSKYSDVEWGKKVEISYNLQRLTEKRILDVVRKYVEQTGIKNVILTGGVSLNCVSNFNLVKKMPDVEFHIDPICSDNGISIGRGLITYIEKTGNLPNRIKNCYLGHQEDKIPLKQKIQKSNLNYTENVKYSDIVEILLKGNIVGLFQGKSESGQRALGNRSFLFDPRIENGRTIVNKIKKREDFRPFAASVLLEHAKDWFNIGSLKESSTMSFAVDAYEKAMNEVPSVIHADGTCRIQTVTEEQNKHLYNLISEFYKNTGVPMLLNTSFNLAGSPLVDTFDDALGVMKSSKLKYIYLPEVNILIS